MRTLIYKRTHPGDPDAAGRFGIHDCMGKVRLWDFDAVIGVGGIGPEPERHGLSEKVNWIGIGPHKRAVVGKRGPIVTFDHFLFYEARGPSFRKCAPKLAARMYASNVRVLMDALDSGERKEVAGLLDSAKHAPPSSGAVPRRRPNLDACRPTPRRPKSVKGCWPRLGRCLAARTSS